MKSKKIDNLVIKCVAALLFPMVLCAVFCWIRGTSLFEMYAPDSYNNDSFFYYKMVQGVLDNGIPKGYFGYNESRAAIGSFGVWSPLILIPWVVWGVLFGWGYTSAFACNIVFFSIAMLTFVVLSRIDGKGMICMFCMLSVVPSLPLHLLSCLPEANLLSIVLIYISLGIGFQYTSHKRLFIVVMSVLCIMLTIIRPFMVILAVIPCYYLFKGKIKGAIFYTFGIIIGGVGLYFLGSRFLSAPYFNELFDFSLLENILHGNINAAIGYVLGCIRKVVPQLLSYIEQAFSYGLTAGTQYVTAIATAVLLCYHVFLDKKANNKIVYIMLILMDVALICAVILLHGKVNEGGRHIFVFAIIGCIICSLEKGAVSYISRILIGFIFAFMIYQGALIPTDYDIPIQKEATRVSIEYWENAFEENGVTLSENVGWENTLIWSFSNYNELYATPEGMGVSCCFPAYIIENFSALKSRYIAVSSGSEIDTMCMDAGFDEIGRTAQVVIYQRY